MSNEERLSVLRQILELSKISVKNCLPVFPVSGYFVLSGQGQVRDSFLSPSRDVKMNLPEIKG